MTKPLFTPTRAGAKYPQRPESVPLCVRGRSLDAPPRVVLHSRSIVLSSRHELTPLVRAPSPSHIDHLDIQLNRRPGPLDSPIRRLTSSPPGRCAAITCPWPESLRAPGAGLRTLEHPGTSVLIIDIARPFRDHFQSPLRPLIGAKSRAGVFRSVSGPRAARFISISGDMPWVVQ